MLDVAFAVDKVVAPFDSHHVVMLRDGVVRPTQKPGAGGIVDEHVGVLRNRAGSRGSGGGVGSRAESW